MSSASSIVVPSIFVLHFVDSAQFLNAGYVSGASTTVILPVTNM